ncbi:MAG: hypothetical protein ACD_20C00346G0009 [uncultured bacterium]|nr:MAG: hypothetical protein ACD_20C00346G0009 [uncultured bacterium]HBH18443.1 hypothetical protein [Cyanobacteria bacterium UBA9579]
MRTININLIGKKDKETKKTPALIENVDDKTRLISFTLTTGALVVLVLSAGIGFSASYSAQKISSELSELRIEHEKLKAELATNKSIYKNLLKDKKILDLKLLAQNQVESSILPWHSILTDIENTVPKDIKITKILKAKAASSGIGLNIQGHTNSRRSPKENLLEQISFFVLNINENSLLSSYLANAVIKTADYVEKDEAYNFTIETSLDLSKKETKE